MIIDAVGQVRPADDTWVTSVHASDDSEEPLGSGVVIDQQQVLTCAHVVGRPGKGRIWTTKSPQLWVSFPKALGGGADRRLPVEKIVFPVPGVRVKDLAVLYLSGPVSPGVTIAPLRCPRPGDLVAKRWWAFGFPDGDPIGDSADGQVGDALGHGWIRLDTGSRYPVRPGFSGGGLWSPDYQAVVGVVGQAHGDTGDGRAIALHQVGEWFPNEEIGSLAERWSASQAGEVAMAAWGWSLSGDPEATRHWRPRGRGVSVDSERGYRFRGRTTALEAIREWLDRDEENHRVLLVTGAPGVGKSAVLGRIVTTADWDAAQQLPTSDAGVRATTGSVGCAVHAKGKTALEVAAEIARAASAGLPERIEDFVPALREALSEQGRRFNVVIDALDEAAGPVEARAVITKVILPVAETCSDVGARVTVGSRRTDSGGDLLGVFDAAAQLVDLDDPEFFSEGDLAAYALATLQLTGAERPGNPYANDVVATPVASRIAELSDRNFLVAGLTARSHGLYDEAPALAAELEFSAKVDDAMREYLRRIPSMADGVTAETLLAPLAFAEAPGLTASLWRTALWELDAEDVPEAVLMRFARSSVATYLVESSSGVGRDPTFRLFHQALNDALLRARAGIAERDGEERALAQAFQRVGQDVGWDRAPAYLLRSLPVHAASGRVIDDLLADDDYMLYADLRRVMQAAGQAQSPAAQDRNRLLRLTLEAVTATPDRRAAMFSVTEALESLGSAYRAGQHPGPYRAQWAAAKPSLENLTLRNPGGEVWAVCPVEYGSRSLLAAASSEETVRLWDPVEGSLARSLEGHQYWVRAVCTVPTGGRDLLASGSDDQTVRLWDPADGSLIRVLEGHQDAVAALCAVSVGDRVLLASGSDDQTVRLWDPADGSLIRVLEGHQSWVRAVCSVESAGQILLASSSDDRTVRLWDPADGSLIRVLEGHRRPVHAVCAVPVGDRVLLASGSDDRTVRLWDPADGSLIRVLEGHQDAVAALCAVPIGGRVLLVSSDDLTVRLWDPVDGSLIRSLEGHQDAVTALCAVPVGDRVLLASGSDDQTVRLWDFRLDSSDTAGLASLGPVGAMCAVPSRDQVLLATTNNDRTVRLWDPVDGSLIRSLEGHQDTAWGVCALPVGDRILVATTSYDLTVRLWDPVSGTLVRVLEGHQGTVWGVCAVSAGDRILVATGSSDGTVRLWDPGDAALGRDGSLIRTLEGHQDVVGTVCAVSAGDRTLLASGSDDWTVRLWDPVTGTLVRVLEGHGGTVWAVCPVRVGDRILLATTSHDQTARLWDPVTGTLVRVLEGHQGPVRGVCPVRVGDRILIATTSHDQTVRLWDPEDGRHVLTMPVHHSALVPVPVADSLAVGLAVGVLSVQFEPGASA